jgi:hypothetical protein
VPSLQKQPRYAQHFARTKIKGLKIMFIQSKAATSNKHVNGLAIEQRRGGKETLIQWSNGDQQWCQTEDLQYFGSTITLIGRGDG